MFTITNSKYYGKCCAICQYWCGEAMLSFNFETGAAVYESNIISECEYHQNETRADELCEAFKTEYIYS